jgi:hypothetical protein
MACATALACTVSATGNQCATCGGLGQPCCGTNNGVTCNSGLACGGRNAGAGTPGMCSTCGGTGQLCCPANAAGADGGPPPPACMAALSCTLATGGNSCATCGGPGQPCCGTNNAGTCDTGLACGGRNLGMAVPGMFAACGGAGQLCCPAIANPDGGVGQTQCGTTMSCLVSATGNQCGTCGGAGQPCCGTGNNGTCTAGAGLNCVGRMAGTGVPGTCTAAVRPDAGAVDAPVGQ